MLRLSSLNGGGIALLVVLAGVAYLTTREGPAPPAEMELVFVYGTLKTGYWNYERVMVPRLNEGGFFRPWTPPGEAEAAVAPTSKPRFTAQGALLFTDHYWATYLVVPDGGEEVGGSTAVHSPAGQRSASAATVVGEVFEVDASMLAALDELEGVAQGRYVRSRISVTAERQGGRSDALECWVYHLKEWPPASVELFWGEGGDPASNNLLGVDEVRSAVNRLWVIPEYTFEAHKRLFVPPHTGERDMALYTKYGFFLRTEAPPSMTS